MVISSDSKPPDSPPLDEDDGVDEELGESIAKTNANEVTTTTTAQAHEASPIKDNKGKEDSYAHDAPIPPTDDPTQAHNTQTLNNPPTSNNPAPWTRILGSPPPAPRRASIPGAHHVPGPGAENESSTSADDANNNNENEEEDDNHLNNELDRLGIHGAVAEAVPVNNNEDDDDAKSHDENIGGDVEQGDNSGGGGNSGSSPNNNNNQDIFYTADPITIKTINILGHEVSSSNLKLMFIACGISLVMFATIITPIMVVMSNNREDQQQENQQSMMPEESMPPAVPPPGLPNHKDLDKPCMTNITDCISSVNFEKIGYLISTEESLSDPTSPQYLSREWMLGETLSEIDNLPVKAGQRRWVQERYILGVLYYATGGMDWFKNEGIVGSSNHCNNDAGTIICDEESRVVEIRLGTFNVVVLYSFLHGLTSFFILQMPHHHSFSSSSHREQQSPWYYSGGIAASTFLTPFEPRE